MDRPSWLTDQMLERAKSLWPAGRTKFEQELGLGSYRSRALVNYLRSTVGTGEQVSEKPELILLPHLIDIPRSLLELADIIDRSPTTVLTWIGWLRDAGHPVREIEGRYYVDRTGAPTGEEHVLNIDGATVRLGFVSDTHLGSRYQQITYLKRCYEWFASEGVRNVYHAGDLIDGVGVYRGQHADLFLHLYQDQVDYTIEHYPRINGITTHIIAGNHDFAAVKAGGVNPVQAVAAQRPDIRSLGAFSAWVTIGDSLRLYLLHPDGGGSYAVSYRLQKIVESFEGGRKPHILVAGHWHQRAYVDARNVDAYLPGCFQSQTPYETVRALQPRLGALMLEIRIGDHPGEYAVRQTFKRYLIPLEEDWK